MTRQQTPRLPAVRSPYCQQVCDYAASIEVWPVQFCDGDCFAITHRVSSDDTPAADDRRPPDAARGQS